MFVTDRLTIHDKRRTNDGYLVTDARFARSGIYEYAGRDVGKPEMDKVRVYRPDEEVFAQDAMASFAHRPITNDHPDDNVNSQTWKRDAVGFTDGRVARDGDFVVVPMMITDQASIDDVDAGKAELSAGYDCDLEFVDGETDQGQKYDAIMRNIRGNHIAIVDKGRAGSECRIGDRFEEKDMQLKKIMVDGLQVETTDAGEAAIIKLQSDVSTAKDALSTATAQHDKAIAAKDTELAAKDAEIADLKGKVLDAAAMDKLVADRAALAGIAGRLVDGFDAKGKDSATIKREVVAAKCGDAAVADKSEAYVDARFDALADALSKDGNQVDAIRDHMISTGPSSVLGSTKTVADAQRDEQAALAEASDLNGWRTKAK